MIGSGAIMLIAWAAAVSDVRMVLTPIEQLSRRAETMSEADLGNGWCWILPFASSIA